MERAFVPGLELSRLYYEAEVRPILARSFPNLAYSAALIGLGSEVLGFDNEMSTDHDWGPRLWLFLRKDDAEQLGEDVRHALTTSLPDFFLGYPTRFVLNADRTGRLDCQGEHRVLVTSIEKFLLAYLAYDVSKPLEPADWLTIPEQKLRTLVHGAVYHDGIGLNQIRQRFDYYPHDVWLYQLASAWERIGQEEHLVGRAGHVGDELGASLIASRLIRDLMRLCFLMERQYAPYPKWFGTAFSRLASASEMTPLLMAVQRATEWKERDERLASSYRFIARKQKGLKLCQPRPSEPLYFYNRPFHVIELHAAFAENLRAQIADPVVREIATRRSIGSIDMFSDSTDLLSEPSRRPLLRRLYEP